MDAVETDTIVRTLTADRGDAGRRLDLVLMRQLTGLRGATRTRLQRWIEDGRVRLNGRQVRRAATRTNAGDSIAVLVPVDAVRASYLDDDLAAASSDLEVLFEDEHLLAVNKPAGIVVHPTYKHVSGTLMDALRANARSWPDGTRPSILGRLDRLTSGVVLVAKRATLHASLQRILAAASSHKVYLAIAYGPIREALGTIDLPLARDPADRRRVVVSDGGVPSVTRFERLARTSGHQAGIALVRCRLLTGRTHQLRVHLAARRWPIVGDPVYGEPRWSTIADPQLATMLQAFTRQMLHAHRVVFVHPVTRATVSIEAPLPDDMQSVIDYCGWERFQRF